MQLLTIQFVFSRYDILTQKGNRMYANQENIDKLEAVQVTKAPPTTTATIKYEVEYNEKEPLTDGTGTVPSHVREEGEPCKYAVA